MGFSFRNLFPDKEGDDPGQASQSFGAGLPEQRDANVENSAMPQPGGQPVGGSAPLFGNAQPTDRGSFEQMFAGARPNEMASGDNVPANATQGGGAPAMMATYLAGELLQFIPPALASPDAVPMEQPVQVNLPMDGSRDVKLSDLYMGCPQLFATEITPLNDSQVTLPEPGLPGGDTGAILGNIPAEAMAAPSNPFGNPSLVEDQQGAPPAAVGAPNPFDPRTASGGEMGVAAGTGMAPQATTPAPMSWQPEATEPSPDQAPHPFQTAQQPAELQGEAAEAFPPVDPPGIATGNGSHPDAQAFASPSGGEQPPAGGEFSGQPTFDPQASMAGPQSMPPFSPPADSPFASDPENAAPEPAPAPAFEPTPGAPAAEQDVPADSPFADAAGGGDAPFAESPFDLDEDNPFFLAEDDDVEDDVQEGQGDDLDDAFGQVAVESDASPFAAEAPSAPSADPAHAAGLPAEQMGALEPPPSNHEAPADPVMPWPAAPGEDPSSSGDAFSGAGAVAEAAVPEGHTASPDFDPAPNANSETSIFGESSLVEQAPMGAESAPSPAPASEPVSPEDLATSFAAAVPADPNSSLLTPSPFEETAPQAETESEPKRDTVDEVVEVGSPWIAASVEPGDVPEEEFAADVAAPAEEKAEATLSFVVRDLLFPHEPQALGFSAEELPYELKAELPLTRIEPQLASGRVTVSLGDLAAAVDPHYGQTLAQGNQGLEIELPPTALFHQLERVSQKKASSSVEASPDPDAGKETETPATPLFSTEVPSGDSPQEESEISLPPTGASSGFSTPFSDLAKEDADQAEPAQETRFSAQPMGEESDRVQMRFGTYAAPGADGVETSPVESSIGGEKERAESSPPPLPALQSGDDEKAQSAAGSSGSGNSWQAAQIPGPLHQSGNANLGDQSAAETESVEEQAAEENAVSEQAITGNESIVDPPEPSSRAINISLGPGAVTAAKLEEKLSPLSGTGADAGTDKNAEPESPAAEAELTTGDSDSGPALGVPSDDKSYHADLISDSAPAADGAAAAENSFDGEGASEKADDGAESMIFTSSRPDDDSAREGGTKLSSAMAEDSLDTLPSFADLPTPEGDNSEAVLHQHDSDFFAELEPPPFSFQDELVPQPVATGAGQGQEEDERDGDVIGTDELEEREFAAEIPVPASGTTERFDGDEFRDLELRAVFGTTEEFTLRRVAELTLDLCSTVDSCALLTRSRAVDVSRRDGLADDGEAQRRARQARAMHRNLRDLADNAGLTQAQALTLHTDREAISFFQRGDVCLTVRHDRSGFPAGVREKLMLVAHGVAAMEERR